MENGEKQRREKWRSRGGMKGGGGGEGDGGRGGGIQVRFISDHLPSVMLRCLMSGIWNRRVPLYITTQLNFATCFSAH